MPRFEKKGEKAIFTTNKVEATRLKASGYREAKARTNAEKEAEAAVVQAEKEAKAADEKK